VLDPAHGGPDSGARSSAGVAESEVVLDFARAVRVSLEAQGLRVLLTREGDQDPSFDDRASLINGLRGAIFISLHVSSNGPVGTARAYSYVFPAVVSTPVAAPTSSPSASPASASAHPAQRPATAAVHSGLIEWDRAQFSYTDESRRLAELVQIQLAQKLRGSPDTPFEVPVRQLRTVAAPAIAIEVSSVAVPDAKRLTQLNQPLADAVARAVVDFRAASGGGGQ
jgi:N-acetylmuramoyl-L-alanine amidase